MSNAIPGWLRLSLLGGTVVAGFAIAMLFLVPADDPAPPAMQAPGLPSPGPPMPSRTVSGSRGPANEAPAPIIAAPPSASATAKPSFDVVTMSPEGSTVIAGRAMPNADVTVRAGTDDLGHVKADERGNWVLLPDKKLTAGPQTLTLSEKLPGGATVDGSDHVELTVRAPTQAAPTAVAAAASLLGEARATRAATASIAQVVVQPGENLWKLARNAYGSGPRYIVIYRANQDKIHEPNKIFPGQELAVPATAGVEADQSMMPDSSSRSR